MSPGGGKRGAACPLANPYAQIIHEKENGHISNSFLPARVQTSNAAFLEIFRAPMTFIASVSPDSVRVCESL